MPENFEQLKSKHNQDIMLSPLERVAQLRQLQLQVFQKDNFDSRCRLNEGKQQLTQGLESVLNNAVLLSSEDKLVLISEIVPLVEWGYRKAPFYGGDEEEAKEEKDKATSEPRHLALANLLNSIPNQDLNEQTLNNLLALDESIAKEKLFEIRQRVVQAIKEMPPKKGKIFLPKLKPQITYAGSKSHPSEWVEVLRNWPTEDARPYVDQLVEQIDQDKTVEQLDKFRTVTNVIEKWPSKQQERVVRQVLIQHDLNGLWGNSYFKLVSQWDLKLAKSLLRDLLAKPIEARIGVTYADRNYGSLAIAMSNWSSKEVNAFLNDKNNTRWVRDVAQAESQEKNYKQNYVTRLNKFKLSTLKERDANFNDEHFRWITKGFIVGNSSEVTSVVLKHPELFTPKVASRIFLISKGYEQPIKVAIKLFSALPGEQQLAYQSAIVNLLMGDQLSDHKELFNEILQKWTEKAIDGLAIELLSRGREDIIKYRFNSGRRKTVNIVNAFKLLQQKKEVLIDHELIKKVLKYSIGEPDSDEGEAANVLVGKIERNKETEKLIVGTVGDVIAMKFRKLTQQTIDEIYEIATKYELDLMSYVDKLPVYVQSLIESFRIINISDLVKFVKSNFEYISFLASNPDEPSQIIPEDIPALSSLNLSFLEAEEVVRSGVSLTEIKIEDDYKKLFEILVKVDQNWQNEQSIINPFKTGAEIFGYKRMLDYLKRQGVSLHDNFHAFEKIIELYSISGLGANEFFGQVLQQVRMDDREYSEGTAHHHLNAIAQTANKNVSEIIAKVQEYKEIEKLQELAETFSSPQAVFASWINLKRYSELEQLLGQTEIFDELKELKAEGKEALYKYVETLAFHPDSKVNMSAVMQFWREPESFLAAEASHTPYEVHDQKKPSNYINMPNLDLTASDLRDALVEGRMDGLSVFTPIEIHYTIPIGEIKQKPLPDLVQSALGSNKKGIEGSTRNSKKLFSELEKLLKPHGLSVVDYIQGKALPEGIDISHQIETLLYDRNFGMERPLVKTREFVARISRKSDPEGAIAGDDTVNCMPFGDGKNTVYTFNPNTAQFVIRVVKGDGKERTIAQSVLTKDMDIKTLVPDVISKLQQEGGHLEDILPADILATVPAYAACDNVEVAPNYSDERHQQIIGAIFRDFFREYMSRYAKTEGLNSKKVPIGQGYTDALSQLPTETNTFAPQAPVSYSDKTGVSVYMLDLESNAGMNLIWQKQVQETKVEKPKEPPLPKMKGLGYLTFEDTLKVAYLEGKAYSNNQSLMQFLFNMENGLIAKDINNVAKERPNMSVKYTDEAGRMHGYMLAWEGRLSDENVEYNAREFFDQPCVYIIDIATDRENRMAGGRLIRGFTELYKQNYIDKENAMPIFAQARESTSYQIVKRQLDKLGKDAGYNFELLELPTYEVGEDVMHPIIIRPVSKKK